MGSVRMDRSLDNESNDLILVVAASLCVASMRGAPWLASIRRRSLTCLSHFCPLRTGIQLRLRLWRQEVFEVEISNPDVTFKVKPKAFYLSTLNYCQFDVRPW
jgi:hypothetical protein